MAGLFCGFLIKIILTFFYIILFCLFIYSFAYLSIYYLFIPITTEHKTSFFKFFVYLSVCMLSTVSLLVHLYLSLSFCSLTSMFFCLNVSQFLYLQVCLLFLFLLVIIFAKRLYCYCKFGICNSVFIFFSIITHHISFFLFDWPIGEEFKVLGLSSIVYLYPSIVWVSHAHYSVLLVLQSVAFLFLAI